VVGLSGVTVAHFWAALILLGLGWNLSFVGATTMVCDCHRPEERNKVQAFNDFLIFGSMAIGSFFSLSLDPSLVGFCAAKTSSSWSEIKRSGRFCANVLAHDQQELCRIFAVSGGDKFREVGWEPGASGAPRLDGVLAWVECTIEAVHDGGDHEICIGRVDALGIERNCAPLIFFRGGHSLNSACRHRGGTAPVRSRRPHRPCNST